MTRVSIDICHYLYHHISTCVHSSDVLGELQTEHKTSIRIVDVSIIGIR